MSQFSLRKLSTNNNEYILELYNSKNRRCSAYLINTILDRSNIIDLKNTISNKIYKRLFFMNFIIDFDDNKISFRKYKKTKGWINNIKLKDNSLIECLNKIINKDYSIKITKFDFFIILLFSIILLSIFFYQS